MTDDIVKRLRRTSMCAEMDIAADFIEQQAAEIMRLTQALQRCSLSRYNAQLEAELALREPPTEKTND